MRHLRNNISLEITGKTAKKHKLSALLKKGISAVTYVLVDFLANSIKFESIGMELICNEVLVGFWHGDSIAALTMLYNLDNTSTNAKIVITSSWRGDAIARAVEKCGYNYIRMDDGLGARKNIQELKKAGSSRDAFLGVTLDGPLGPKHLPKKMLFRISEENNRELLTLSFRYSKGIRLNRWDDYAIPLPFSRVIMNVENIGTVSKEALQGYDKLISKIKI